MARIYGHTWSERWGDAGEQKMIKVYSNCDEAELFVNGKSYGVKKRNSQDFPAAGLRWLVDLKPGGNQIRVVARKGNVTVTDEISQSYQTEKWAKPATMKLEKISEENGVATVRVKLYDANNIRCLDAANWIEFGLTGDGELIDNQGTSIGSRKVQAYNGWAMIRVRTAGGKNTVSVRSAGLPTVLLNL
jgi:beta-galactosidase